MEERQHRRAEEWIVLRFLTLACLIQFLLCRGFVVENPGPSEIWSESPLKELEYGIGRKYVLDQCMYGAVCDELPARKTTALVTNLAVSPFVHRCDGSHAHCALQGGAKTARSAVYPQGLCDAILQMSSCVSSDPVGGRVTFAGSPQGHHFADMAHSFVDLRAMATQRGVQHVWDRAPTHLFTFILPCGDFSPK